MKTYFISYHAQEGEEPYPLQVPISFQTAELKTATIDTLKERTKNTIEDLYPLCSIENVQLFNGSEELVGKKLLTEVLDNSAQLSITIHPLLILEKNLLDEDPLETVFETVNLNNEDHDEEKGKEFFYLTDEPSPTGWNQFISNVTQNIDDINLDFLPVDDKLENENSENAKTVLEKFRAREYKITGKKIENDQLQILYTQTNSNRILTVPLSTEACEYLNGELIRLTRASRETMDSPYDEEIHEIPQIQEEASQSPDKSVELWRTIEDLTAKGQFEEDNDLSELDKLIMGMHRQDLTLDNVLYEPKNKGYRILFHNSNELSISSLFIPDSECAQVLSKAAQSQQTHADRHSNRLLQLSRVDRETKEFKEQQNSLLPRGRGTSTDVSDASDLSRPHSNYPWLVGSFLVLIVLTGVISELTGIGLLANWDFMTHGISKFNDKTSLEINTNHLAISFMIATPGMFFLVVLYSIGKDLYAGKPTLINRISDHLSSLCDCVSAIFRRPATPANSSTPKAQQIESSQETTFV